MATTTESNPPANDSKGFSSLEELNLEKSILRRGLATAREIEACKAHRAKLSGSDASKSLLDIMVDDQDHTYTLLAQGLALAGVSSHPEPMRGCEVQALGAMRYRLLASPSFQRKWFPDGLQRDAARLAPLMVFDRKDTLQAAFLQRELGLPPGSYPSHFMPASEAFLNAVRLGLGYGMIPEQQYGSGVDEGKLVDLAPDKPTDVMLYWHAWRVQSPKLERLSAQVLAAARSVLQQ